MNITISANNYFSNVSEFSNKLTGATKQAHELFMEMHNDGISEPFDTKDTDIDELGEMLLSEVNRILNTDKNLDKWLSELANMSENLDDNRLGAPYFPATDSCNKMDVEVPDSMDFETHSALDKMKEAIGGDVVGFVAKKLGYSDIELCKSLFAEQIDGVALAIYNIEKKNQGIIIGDQTGIGKGRQAAAIIRYAVKQGLKPLFLTEKANLFTDIFRDLAGIGSGDLKPFIMNTTDPKTGSKVKILDQNAETVYESLSKVETDEIINSVNLDDFDFVVSTYSQFNRNNLSTDPKEYNIDKKGLFLQIIAQNNILILDESHNASGASNTGKFFTSVLSTAKGCVYLSATFAKTPANMPVYSVKTSLKDTNMTDEEFILAFEKGGVALQELVSAQLVQEGQMIRRQRTYEGIETHYLTMSEQKDLHIAIADSITAVIRRIITFEEDFINPKIDDFTDNLLKKGGYAEKTKGTSKAGISNSPLFSKIFRVISQMLFSIKAEDIADFAIQKMRENKQVIIAFSETMETFISEFNTNEIINANFSEVLLRALRNTLKYTEKDNEGNPTTRFIAVSELSMEAQLEFRGIEKMIQETSLGISISPIDKIMEKIKNAGFKAIEVTGRKKTLTYLDREEADNLKIKFPEKYKENKGQLKSITQINETAQKLITKQQMAALLDSGTDEHWDVFDNIEKSGLEAQKRNLEKEYKEFSKDNPGKSYDWFARNYATPILHYFNSSSDWYIYEWDKKADRFYGYVVLNGDWEMSEWGYISVDEITNIRGFNAPQLDFFFVPQMLITYMKRSGHFADEELQGLGAARESEEKEKLFAVVGLKPKEAVAQSFLKFQNNEVECLLINQSGSTGASAHAIPTTKVPADKVKQRVMIILQPELNINTEVQKRGRINRTGQILKPAYYYLSSEIPAEQRLMMMLQRKLKSLDANTSSDQKESKDLLNVPDFLNKYGDKIVYQYLLDNPDINRQLGDPAKLNDLTFEQKQEEPNSEKYIGLGLKVSGRVAILKVSDQDKFYRTIIEQYDIYVNMLKQREAFDLEMQTLELDAKTIKRDIVIINPNAGKSIFSNNTYLEEINCRNLRKPYRKDEIDVIIKQALGDKLAVDVQQETLRKFEDFFENKEQVLESDLKVRFERNIEKIKTSATYLSIENESEKQEYYEEKLEKVKLEQDRFREKQIQDLLATKNHLQGILSFFYVGRSIEYPISTRGTAVIYSRGVFLGFKIDENKQNPYAPSSIIAQFALVNSMRRIDSPLSGESAKEIIICKSESISITENYLENWTNYTKSSSSDRTTRYVVTGNIIPAINNEDYNRGQVVSYTTSNNTISKGLLMPEKWKNEDSGSQSQNEILVPIYMAINYLKEIISYKKQVETNTVLKIISNLSYKFSIEVPLSQKDGSVYYQDPDLLKLIRGNNFNKAGNSMYGVIEDEDLDRVLMLLQDKFKISAKVPITIFEKMKAEGSITDTEIVSTVKNPVQVPEKYPASEPEVDLTTQELVPEPKEGPMLVPADFTTTQPDRSQKVTLEVLADRLKGKLWEKGTMRRVYLNDRGFNTKKVTTKTFIWQDENGDFKVSCKIDSTQTRQWEISQEEIVKEEVYDDIWAILKESAQNSKSPVSEEKTENKTDEQKQADLLKLWEWEMELATMSLALENFDF